MDASHSHLLKTRHPSSVTGSVEVCRFSSLAEASQAGARIIVESAADCAAAGRPFSLALAGGSTPATLYHLLTQPPYVDRLPRSLIHLFWGDERCVPPDHAFSNFRMSKQHLLDPLQLPADQVHRMPVEITPPHSAAQHYEAQLRRFFHIPKGHPGIPQFDVILLGMGGDGHTASLLPGTAALTEQRQWVTVVDGRTADPAVDRITLTLPVLNHAKTVLILAAGAAKAALLEEILEQPATAKYPVTLLQPAGRLIYLVGQSA